MNTISIIPIAAKYREVVKELLIQEWGATLMIVRGKQYHADQLPGFIALLDGEPKGLVTYTLQEKECEIITFNSLRPNLGIGTQLLEAVKKVALEKHCLKIVVITTNDNLAAFRYYQIKGFTLAQIYPNSMEQVRKIKPQVPLIGMNKIPLRDEIEFHLQLT